MKRNRIRIIALLVLLGMVAGCRYEDGPLISLRSKESRIVGGKKIILYEVDGIDSTGYFESAFSNTTYDSTGFQWLSENENSQVFCTAGCFTGYWEFQQDKKTIFVRLPSPTTGGFSFPDGIWEILKLTKRDFWIKNTFGGKEYLIKFEQTPNT
jgi:hypothetical protein